MRPGEILVGKYRVERVLGQGGMGVVVQATHLQLGQPVAIKCLLPEMIAVPGVVDRFLREAQAAVRLRGEHVARVIDVGTLENDAPFMVLEYLDGADLARLPRGQLDLGTIVDLMMQACEALAEAHALGIVHRDIKPANFFITRGPDGQYLLKVLDFGISKVTSELDARLTATQTVIGTPTYMSPEQVRSSREVDQRSDLWSLGVVLYELLEGVPPFHAETFTSLAIQIATEPVRALSGTYPPGLGEAILRCLEKDPARRFRDVAELARALAPHARSTTQAAITLERTGRVLRASEPSLEPTRIMSPPSTLTTASGAFGGDVPRARPRWPWYAAAGVVAATIGGIAIVLASSGSPAPTAPTPAPEHKVMAPVRYEPPAAPPPTPPPPPPPTPTVAPVDAGVRTSTPDAPVKRPPVKHHVAVDAGNDDILEGRQ